MKPIVVLAMVWLAMPAVVVLLAKLDDWLSRKFPNL